MFRRKYRPRQRTATTHRTRAADTSSSHTWSPAGCSRKRRDGSPHAASPKPFLRFILIFKQARIPIYGAESPFPSFGVLFYSFSNPDPETQREERERRCSARGNTGNPPKRSLCSLAQKGPIEGKQPAQTTNFRDEETLDIHKREEKPARPGGRSALSSLNLNPLCGASSIAR